MNSEVIWKPIKGYEQEYEISSLAQIRSKRRKVNHGRNQITIKEKIIKQQKSCGYPIVKLSKNGESKTFFVHRIVGLHFIPNPYNYDKINHIDGNKQNCLPDNLEWCTHSQNIKHAYRLGLCKVPMGKSKKVIDMSNYKVYNSISDAAAELKIPYSTCKNYLNGNRNNPTHLRYLESIVA